jgi:hypothetical protein
MQVYRKPTHTDRYLDFSSNNPIEHKRAVAATLFHRALTVPTKENDKETEVKHVKTALLMNGYPKKFLRNQLSRVTKKVQSHPQPDTEPSNRRALGFTVLPYIRGVTERVKRVLTKANIQVAVSSRNTLRHKLDRLKDPIEQDKERCVVYKIPCAECDSVYVGQTSVARKTRVAQHEADYRHKRKQKSELIEHHLQTGHAVNFSQALTLHHEDDYRKRIWKESWEIAVHRPAVLNQKSEVTIPAQYLNLQ